MPDCPDDTDLAGFLNDSLTGERLSHLSEHVDGCPLCQERLDRLTEQASGVVARYKDLSDKALLDSRSGNVSPEADTFILGKPKTPAMLVGLPRVPGFDVAAEIGRGGMGVVYKARHRRLNRLVALKMILAGGAADPRIVQRFLLEGEVLARIQHPQVMQVFEVGTYQGPNSVPIPYLAMELLEGGSLSRKLKEQAALHGNGNGNAGGARWPSPRAAAELLEGLARAVHAAHCQGAVHRDLKPGNILFSSDPGARSVERGAQNTEQKTKIRTALFSRPEIRVPHSALAAKVADFGLAKFVETGADLTHTGQIVGTPQYMAPEQAGGARQVGPAADVYALGAILFECLAGRPPFTGSEPMSVLLKVVNEEPPDVRSLRPDVPRDLAAVTMKCLAKEPARRYASAEALANDLRRFLDNRPTRARPATLSERVRLWGKRNPAVASLIAALAVVLATAFVSVAALWVKAERTAEDEIFAKNEAKRALGVAEQEAKNAAASLAESQNQKKLTEAALREARRQEALLKFDRAVVSCEEGRVSEGLRLFLQAADLAEQTGQTDLARVARINIAAWPRDLPPRPRPFAHKQQPRLAAFVPDSDEFVTAGRNGELYLWKSNPQRKLRTYKPARRIGPEILNRLLTYWTVDVSPDGKTVAVGGTDGRITLWDIDKEEPRASFDAVSGSGDVWSLAFASNSVIWANDGKIGLRRWDLSTKPPRATEVGPRPLPKDENVIQILALSPDGKRVYTGDRNGMVREWDAGQLKELRSWDFHGWITDLAVSADGARLAATGSGGFVWEIDLVAGRQILEISLAGAYGDGVAFAPKRPYLIGTDGDGNLRFWHRDTGQPIGIPLRFQGEILRPRFRPKSDEFAVAAGNSVYLSGLPDPPGDLLSAGRGYRIRGLAFSPGGNLGVIDEARFDLFDPRNGKLLQRVGGWGRQEGPLTLHFDPDPTRPVAYRGTRQGFERLAVPNGQRFDQTELKSTGVLGKVFRIECLPGDGGMFVMGQHLVARYDPAMLTKEPRANQPGGNVLSGAELEAMALRPDGKEVLVAFADRVVFLDSVELDFVRGWSIGDSILDARYTPDGKKVIIGRRDNKAELLDAGSGKPTSARSMTHTRAVTAVGVSADCTLLLTGSRDGTARFWDAATGLPLGAPLRHSGPVTHATFSPRSDHIATGTETGHVMIWDLPPPPAKGTIQELEEKLGK